MEIAQVLVERAQVERGLAAALVGLERGPVALAGPIVLPHAVMEETQIVPGRRVARIHVEDALVGVHRGLPALRVAVPLGRALEPHLGRVGGRDERAHHAGQQGLAGLSLEVPDGLEGEQGLAGARIEPQPVLLDHHLPVPHHQAQLGQRRPHVGREAARAVERGAHLAHARPALEQIRGRAHRDQLAEAQAARIVAQQAEAPELRAALGGQAQEPRQLPQREDPFERRINA